MRNGSKAGSCLVLQKNLALWSGAFLVLLLVLVEPQGRAVPGEWLVTTDVKSAQTADQPTVARQDEPSEARPLSTHRPTETMNMVVGVGSIYQWLSNYRTGLSPVEKRQLATVLYRESLRHGFQPELVMAVIAVESSFFNWSRSEQGAIGLMQLQPVTAESVANQWSASGGEVSWRGEEMLYDPMINLRLGLRYLSALQEQFGDLRVALTAYNYGPTRVAEWLAAGEPLPFEYANRVLGLSESFNEQAQSVAAL